MPPETMNDLFAFLTNLMTTHADMFQALGLNLFRALAIILIVWFGVKSALASASGGVGFQLDHFAALLMTISFGFAMITFAPLWRCCRSSNYCWFASPFSMVCRIPKLPIKRAFH